jgi:hypothetical protein
MGLLTGSSSLIFANRSRLAIGHLEQEETEGTEGCDLNPLFALFAPVQLVTEV